MNPPDSESDPLLELAEEFADRFRRGERPSLTEYAARHPQPADRIRNLFPAMVVMEEFGSIAAPPTGPSGSRTDFESNPRQLGQYRIPREVARGGMGIVYEAVQESLGRHVALKVLPAHGLLLPMHLERFRREARAAAKLHHTNIVPVFGVGEDQGVHDYAMQFIQGQGLDSVLHELRRLRRGTEMVEPAQTVSSADGRECRLYLGASLAGGLLTGQFRPNAERAMIKDEPRDAADHSPLSDDVVAGTILIALDDGGAIDGSMHGAVLGVAQALAAVGMQEVGRRHVAGADSGIGLHGNADQAEL